MQRTCTLTFSDGCVTLLKKPANVKQTHFNSIFLYSGHLIEQCAHLASNRKRNHSKVDWWHLGKVQSVQALRRHQACVEEHSKHKRTDETYFLKCLFHSLFQCICRSQEVFVPGFTEPLTFACSTSSTSLKLSAEIQADSCKLAM